MIKAIKEIKEFLSYSVLKLLDSLQLYSYFPAAPLKMKQKLPGSRQGLATIPHITNIDPFPNNTQVRPE